MPMKIIHDALPQVSAFKGALVEMLAGSGLGAVFGYVAAAFQDANDIKTLLMTIGAGGLSAVMLAIPKIIIARSKAHAVEAESTGKGWSQMMAEQRHIHVKELAYANGKRDEAERQNHIVRAAKHRALGECQRLAFHVQNYEDLLTQSGVKFTPVKIKSMEQILGNEDAQMMATLETRNPSP